MLELTRHPAWIRSRNPLLMLLAGWMSFSFVVHTFVVSLNRITVPILGLPLGFYMAVQGALVVFVILLFWFTRRPK